MTQADRMATANVRIEHLIWLPGILAQPNEAFEELIEEDLDGEAELLKTLPCLRKYVETDIEYDFEELVNELHEAGHSGFLAQMATPIPSHFHEGEGLGFTYSWGHSQLRWFYFQTLEALVDRAETWAAEVVEKYRQADKRKRTEGD